MFILAPETIALPGRALDPSICAPGVLDQCNLRPWIHGAIVSEAKISLKSSKKFIFKVIFVSHCHFRDIYNPYYHFLRGNILRDGTFNELRHISLIQVFGTNQIMPCSPTPPVLTLTSPVLTVPLFSVLTHVFLTVSSWHILSPKSHLILSPVHSSLPFSPKHAKTL